MLATGCGRAAPALPHVLLITLDTTRPDHLGAYGDRRARTPHLDAIARDGVLFERVVSAAPITLPAHVSLFTGLYPFRHGVRNNGNFVLGESVPTLATVLHDRGYRSAAFVSAFVLDRRYGLARGFDEYDDRAELERKGDATAAAAAEWLARNAQPGAKLFAWVHLYDPHDPYEPPDRLRAAFPDRPYDGEIAFADEAVGTLMDTLQRLGLADDTLVAVAGDHGESLGEHGEATHGMFVYESAVRVPMLLRWPRGIAAGRRVASLVRTVDLAPTLLAYASAPVPEGLDGRSLANLVGGSAAGPGEAYSETYFPQLFMGWAPLRSIQDERWKLIDGPAPELYDLESDRAELRDLRPVQQARAGALARAIAALTGGQEGPIVPLPMDRETSRKLAALGYVSGSAEPSHDPAVDRPDPKAMIGVFNRLREANASLQGGRFAAAEAAAADALARDRGNGFAALILARARLAQGRYREAIDAFQRYAQLVPSSADAHHGIAVAASRLGSVDRALAEEDAALAIDPRHAEARALRGGLLAQRGRFDDAVRDLRAAVEAAPANAGFAVGLSRVLLASGRLDEARANLDRVLAREPDNPDARAALGGVLLARDDAAGALREFERALAGRPDADDIRLDFADTLDRVGRTAEARAQYTRLATAPETPSDIRAKARTRVK